MKILVIAALATTISMASFAQGPGHQRTNIAHHQRVNEVNARIDNQERRIKDERGEGDLSKAQARQDRQNLYSINQEKKDMRKMDDGHLTKADKKALNQQLNRNSKQIGH